MVKCNSCIHNEACKAWIRHGEILYDDFEYTVEDCPFYDKVSNGNWIVGMDGSYMCSECGRVFRYEIGCYCPFCGAKLEYEE